MAEVYFPTVNRTEKPTVLPGTESGAAPSASPQETILRYLHEIRMQCDSCGAKGTAWFREDADAQYRLAIRMGHCTGDCRFCGKEGVEFSVVETPLPKYTRLPPAARSCVAITSSAPAIAPDPVALRVLPNDGPCPPSDICAVCGQKLYDWEAKMKPSKIGSVCVVCRARWGMDQRLLRWGRGRTSDARESRSGWEMSPTQEMRYRAHEDQRA